MNIDIRTLLSRLNPECKHAMEQAAQLCVRQTHYNVDVEHLLLTLLELDAPDLHAILAHFQIKPDTLVAEGDRIPRDRDIVLYCTCPSDATSARTALRLRNLGIYRVRPLHGGYDGWKKLGYPLEPMEQRTVA